MFIYILLVIHADIEILLFSLTFSLSLYMYLCIAFIQIYLTHQIVLCFEFRSKINLLIFFMVAPVVPVM